MDFILRIQKMYRAADVAKWFILKGIEENNPLTPMKVLKLTYIAQGIHLAFFNESLFAEGCQAWRYGPVISSIYQQTKAYKREPIKENIFSNYEGIDNDDHETLSILKNIWETFKDWDGLKLSAWTHREGSAWDIAYNKEEGKNYIGYDIGADLLRTEFSKLLKDAPVKREKRPGKL
jgi:uncharacterized phage-associated protein